MTCAPLLPLDPSRSPVGFHPVESKLWEFVEPSGWREIPPLDFLIIFTIATHRFSYTFGAATFVNGLQLGYIRLYPDDPMQAHNPLMNHFHPFLTSRMLISSDMISHSVFSTALKYQNLSNFPIIFLTSVPIFTFPSFFHRFSQHFPPVFHQFSTILATSVVVKAWTPPSTPAPAPARRRRAGGCCAWPRAFRAARGTCRRCRGPWRGHGAWHGGMGG